jgi:hypothetical protein
VLTHAEQLLLHLYSFPELVNTSKDSIFLESKQKMILDIQTSIGRNMMIAEQFVSYEVAAKWWYQSIRFLII